MPTQCVRVRHLDVLFHFLFLCVVVIVFVFAFIFVSRIIECVWLCIIDEPSHHPFIYRFRWICTHARCEYVISMFITWHTSDSTNALYHLSWIFHNCVWCDQNANYVPSIPLQRQRQVILHISSTKEISQIEFHKLSQTNQSSIVSHVAHCFHFLYLWFRYLETSFVTYSLKFAVFKWPKK